VGNSSQQFGYLRCTERSDANPHGVRNICLTDTLIRFCRLAVIAPDAAIFGLCYGLCGGMCHRAQATLNAQDSRRRFGAGPLLPLAHAAQTINCHPADNG
jgi:hypothetical protein